MLSSGRIAASAEARRDDLQRIRGPRGDVESAGRPYVERKVAGSMDRASRLGRGAERRGGGWGPQQGEEPDGQRRGQRQLPEAPPTPSVGIRHGPRAQPRPPVRTSCPRTAPVVSPTTSRCCCPAIASSSGSLTISLGESGHPCPEAQQPTVRRTPLPGGHLGKRRADPGPRRRPVKTTNIQSRRRADRASTRDSRRAACQKYPPTRDFSRRRAMSPAER